jgi:hypothetical protein
MNILKVINQYIVILKVAVYQRGEYMSSWKYGLVHRYI